MHALLRTLRALVERPLRRRRARPHSGSQLTLSGGGTRTAVSLISLSFLVLSFVACRRPTGSLRAERIPKGTAWQCWTGRCDRVCRGHPGPPDDSGFDPEPVCTDQKTAFCVTYELGTTYQLELKPHWECFDTRVSCEANQRHYVAEAKQGRDYSAVSPCTELP